MEKTELYTFVDRFLLHRQEIVKAFKVELSQELLELDLTFPHLLILRIVFLKPDNTVQMASLAGEMKISPAMTTHLVDRLERRGFVERGRDAKDRRVVNVGLSRKGKELVLRLYQLEKQRVASFIEGLGSQDQESFITSVTTLMEILERCGGECLKGLEEPGN